MTTTTDHYDGLDPIQVVLTWLTDANVVPYFQTALYSLVPIKKPGIETLATDMYWRLYYDEEWCRTQPVHVLATALVHELWHNLNQHGIRGKDMPKAVMVLPTGQTYSVWNVAGDLAINSMMGQEMQPHYSPHTGAHVSGAGWQFPPGAVFPSVFNMEENLLEEEYFNQLMENADQVMVASPYGEGEPQPGGSVGKKGSSNSPPDEGESDEENSGGGEDDKDDDDQEGDDQDGQGGGSEGDNEEESEGDSEGDSGEKPAPMMGGCGSSATGEHSPWEDEAPDPEDDTTPQGLNEFESEAVARKTAEAIEEASHTRGDLPGHLTFWARKKLHSKIPWEQQLRQEARRAFDAAAGMTDYTFARRNRRQGMLDRRMVLPGMYHPEVRAAMVVDTSGSMSDEYLEKGIAEVERVARACGAKGVTVLATDAAVHRVQRIRRGESTKVELAGRGGTDMRVGITAAMDLKPQPDVIIVFTDGYTPWPTEPLRGVRLIVCLIGSDRTASRVPEWVKRVISVEDEQRGVR